jgi:hypothetical protein
MTTKARLWKRQPRSKASREGRLQAILTKQRRTRISRLAQDIWENTIQNFGVTVNSDGTPVYDGWAISIPGHSRTVTLPEEIEEYLAEKWDLVRDSSTAKDGMVLYWGSWIDENEGIVLDLTHVRHCTREEAERIGRENGQTAVFNLTTREEVRL